MPAADAQAEAAPAKVNLALHVTGRRADGYHLIDSLAVFPEIGDRVTATPDAGLSLTIGGEFGGGLAATPDNLVLRAARLLAGPGRGAALRLDKRLPVSAGLGGGSADAAATLRLLARLWRLPLPAAADVLALGADLPVCLASRPARMTGVGEILAPADVPRCWLVLCNPGAPLATAEVFGRLVRSDNPPMPPIPRLNSLDALTAFLAAQRNDLEAPARQALPAIGAVLAALAASPGCRLARMSGSGATCFGLFAGREPARAAARRIGAAEPGWWLAAAAVEEAIRRQPRRR